MKKDKVLISITKEALDKLDRIAERSNCGRGTIIEALVSNLTGDEIISLEIKKSYSIQNTKQKK